MCALIKGTYHSTYITGDACLSPHRKRHWRKRYARGESKPHNLLSQKEIYRSEWKTRITLIMSYNILSPNLEADELQVNYHVFINSVAIMYKLWANREEKSIRIHPYRCMIMLQLQRNKYILNIYKEGIIYFSANQKRINTPNQTCVTCCIREGAFNVSDEFILPMNVLLVLRYIFELNFVTTF